MKPDWCDETTWERAKSISGSVGYYSPHGFAEMVARDLIATKNDGLEEAATVCASVAEASVDDYEAGGAYECARSIRLRIQNPPS